MWFKLLYAGFETCFAPSTESAGSKTHLESRGCAILNYTLRLVTGKVGVREEQLCDERLQKRHAQIRTNMPSVYCLCCVRDGRA